MTTMKRSHKRVLFVLGLMFAIIITWPWLVKPGWAYGQLQTTAVDTTSNSVPDVYLGPVAFSEGPNIVFTVTGNLLTISGPASAGTADSIGYGNAVGTGVDAFLYPSYFFEGDGITFTITGEDSLSIVSMWDESADYAWLIDFADGDTLITVTDDDAGLVTLDIGDDQSLLNINNMHRLSVDADSLIIEFTAGDSMMFTATGLHMNNNNVIDIRWLQQFPGSATDFNILSDSDVVFQGPGVFLWTDDPDSVFLTLLTIQGLISDSVGVGGGGSSDSIGYGNAVGTGVDAFLFPSYFFEGAGITFTITGEDSLSVVSTLGTSVDLTAEVTGTLPVTSGGIGRTSITDGAVVLGAGSAQLTHTGVLLDGAFMIGDGVGAPNLSAFSGDVTVTNTGVATIDSTSNNIPFDGAFHITTAVPDSILITAARVGDSLALALRHDGSQALTGNLDGGDFDGTNFEALEADTVTATVQLNIGDGSVSGQIEFAGLTSGSAAIGVAAIAGTPSKIILPTTDGSNGQQLTTDGAGVTSWSAAAGGAGEANTISAVGENATDADTLTAGKAGVDLRVKSVIPGDSMTTVVTDSTVTFNVSGFSNYLPLAGGTMTSGATVNFNNGFINNVQLLGADTIVLNGHDTLTDHDIGAYSLLREVHNATGATLSKGTPVYLSGATGGIPNADSARADNASFMPAFGVIEDDIANGADGHMLTGGTITSYNTSGPGWSVGDELYVAATGGLTSTKPTGTNQIQKIGQVSRVNVSQGEFDVTGPSRVNDLPNIASANFWLGNASGVPTAVTMSSDATMDNAGAVTLASNVARSDGDTYTGVHDFGGATSLEIPNGANPTISAEGQIAQDTDDDALEVTDGSNDMLIPFKRTIGATIWNPDLITDTIPVFYVDSILYPGGIEIVRAELHTSVDGAYSLIIPYYTAADPPVLSDYIDTLVVGASDQRVQSTTFENTTIAIGQIIYIITPATDIDWIRFSLTYYVKENN